MELLDESKEMVYVYRVNLLLQRLL